MAQGIPSLPGFKRSLPQEFNVDDFEEDNENVNEHSEVDLNATANSMDEFGQVENLVVDLATKKVIGGNGRLRKMKERGWKTFIGVAVEGTEDQINTLAVTLNKTGRMSDFNYPKIVARLQQLQHADPRLLALTGFQEYELAPLLSSEMHLPQSEELNEVKPIAKAKSDKDLDARGITIQFNIHQKPIIDQALNKFRTDGGDFQVDPAQCLYEICKRYVNEEEGG